jgi:subfamily B ATP-binding cassette protein MsbA
MFKKFFNKIHILVSTFGPYKKYALVLLFIMITAALCEAIGLGLIIPFLGIILGDVTYAENIKVVSYFNKLFSQIVPEDQRLIGICVIIITIILLKNVFMYLSSVLSIHFYNSLRKYWSAKIMERYIQAEYDYIISQKRGTLINNLINEPMMASKFMAKFSEYTQRIVVALSIYAVMLIASWQVTLLLSLAVFLILGFFWRASTRFSITIGKKRLALNQEITAEGEQSLNGIRQVKLFSLESNVHQSFSKKFNELKRIFVKLGIFQSLPAPAGETLIVLCLVLALVYFQYFSKTPIVAVLPMMAFFATTAQRLYRQIADVISGRMLLLSYIPALKLVHTLIDEKQIKREDLSKGIALGQLSGDIVFENLEFSYDDSSALFKDLNLRIPKNKITAIVGKSGCGKSSIVDLLCGLYKGYKGKIMIGDTELKKLNLSSWRMAIGFVSQDTFLFNESVRENILLGKHDASEEEIKTAARMAYSHEFIENLPKGYDTVLGDRGQKLSGGQRQRITVARALIRSPELLIFDEATSALDSESEKLIQQSIEDLGERKTIIIISHRISTVKNADIIYVLDKGCIIESGTYEELMDKRGFFQSMALQQS